MTRRLTPVALAVAAILLLALAVAARAQSAADPVDQLEGVEVTEHPGAQVPLDLTFRDEDGRNVQLGDYIDGSKPVLLTLNYYRCPMLCTLQLNGLIQALAAMDWTPGQEFEMVTVSINPAETPGMARVKKQNYIEEYGRPSAADGWHFLTGDADAIAELAETVGFGYRYDPETDQYAHAAVTHVLTPEGTLSRYLYGIVYDPQTLRLSLVEAAQGEIGSSLDQVLLTCFHFDPNKGRYTLAAVQLMRLGAVVVMLGLGVSLGSYWTRERRRRTQGTAGGEA